MHEGGSLPAVILLSKLGPAVLPTPPHPTPRLTPAPWQSVCSPTFILPAWAAANPSCLPFGEMDRGGPSLPSCCVPPASAVNPCPAVHALSFLGLPESKRPQLIFSRIFLRLLRISSLRPPPRFLCVAPPSLSPCTSAYVPSPVKSCIRTSLALPEREGTGVSLCSHQVCATPNTMAPCPLQALTHRRARGQEGKKS